MPPTATPSMTPSSFIVSETSAAPSPPLIFSNSPYSCIPLPTTDRRPPPLHHHRDTPACEQRHRHTLRPVPLAPQTPPTINYDKSPYRRVPLPPQTDSNTEIALNPVLELSLAPLINCNFSQPPSSIRVPHGHESCLFEPATEPTLPSLTVITPLLPWAITVHRSSINPAFVTVADVLGTIHSAVQMRVSEVEFKYLESCPGAVQTRNSGVRWRGEYWKDMRRLDYFGGRNMFLGLSKSSMGWDTWVLNVG